MFYAFLVLPGFGFPVCHADGGIQHFFKPRLIG